MLQLRLGVVLPTSCSAVKDRTNPRVVFYTDPHLKDIALLAGAVLVVSKKKVQPLNCANLLDLMTAQKLVYSAKDCGLVFDQLLGLAPEQKGWAANSLIVVDRDRMLTISRTLLSLCDTPGVDILDNNTVTDGDVLAVSLCLDSSHIKLQGFRPGQGWRCLRKADLLPQAKRSHLASASV